jgi:hypothetical protein
MTDAPISTVRVMRSPRLLTIAVVAVSLAGAAAAAQSLADVAKREEERRKDVKTPSKVLTNQDLTPAPATGTPAAPAPGGGGTKTGEAADAAKDAAKDKDGKDAKDKDAKDKDPKDQDKAKDAKDKDAKDKEPVKDQKYWSGRRKALQDALSRDQTFSDALQSRINALNRDFVNEANPVKQRAIGADRQKALDELDRLKKQIVDDQKALSDFDEDARRAGVPPGWLR